ncbi:phosphotransferase family protein [Nocardia sp. NPDC057227]|uniref:phosphotransferase family protein n=1 Tax=Nocardia sp. NPDC057227 TaxID=3346056 RepID=UPI0036378E79
MTIPTPVATAMSIGMGVREALRAAFDRSIGIGADIPLKAERIKPRWLEKVLGLPEGSITAIEVLDEHSGTAARARIAVRSTADIPEHLFLKLPPENYLQHVMMNVFGMGIKETIAYRALGDEPPVRVPRCYAAKVSGFRKRSLLVLEDLSEVARFRTVLDSISDTEAEALVDAFADLHAAFWGTDRFGTDLAPLAERTTASIQLANLIRRRFLEKINGHAAELIPAEMQAQCRIFYQRAPEIDAFWASVPQTLMHGDPHLGNLYFTDAGPGFLDWQIATAGPGIRDVVYSLTASMEPELLRKVERGLVDRYTARLATAGIEVDAERMWTLYRAATTEFYLNAVCTAEASDRMQPLEVSAVGVQRAVAAVAAHDGFGLLTELIDARKN